MRLIGFAVRDLKMAAFMPPFFCVAVGQAMRSFGDQVGTPGSPLAKHPEDYQLYEVGSFDDAEGVLEGGLPRLVCSATDFVSYTELQPTPPDRVRAVRGAGL